MIYFLARPVGEGFEFTSPAYVYEAEAKQDPRFNAEGLRVVPVELVGQVAEPMTTGPWRDMITTFAEAWTERPVEQPCPPYYAEIIRDLLQAASIQRNRELQ